jgi:hypothetical protein
VDPAIFALPKVVEDAPAAFRPTLACLQHETLCPVSSRPSLTCKRVLIMNNVQELTSPIVSYGI